MKLAVNRIIYFTNQMKTMTAFYRDVIGLSPIDNAESDPSGFLEFDAGACTIALHKGSPGKPATREELIRRGAKMGTFNPKGSLHLCDGKDPEGNKFQISNRVRQKG
jgi:hypothetical protein